MPRYWAIAPVESKDADLFDRVWKFDLDNSLISIGWSELGDVFSCTRPELGERVVAAHPDKPRQTQALIANMLWAFFHEIRPGDVVLARRGRKTLAAEGRVTSPAFFSLGRNPHLASAEHSHHSFLPVEWRSSPRDKSYATLAFPMHTLSELPEATYHALVESAAAIVENADLRESVEDQTEFVLEKYLEDFIVANFQAIFKGRLRLYESDGQQYQTDVGTIDILAVDTTDNSLVVLELKKGRPSDQVVGQVLRYMGWVKENLCEIGQSVRGLVICREPDPRLTYALKMTTGVDLRYYAVSFQLRDIP